MATKKKTSRGAARGAKAPAKADAVASYPAFKFAADGAQAHECYVVSIPIDDLFPWCFVSTREKDPRQGFQRLLDRRRAEEIAAFIDAGGVLTQSLTLSAQGAAAWAYDRASKTVRFRRVPKALLVLDGQHRMFGLHLAQRRMRALVTVMVGMDRAEEARVFTDINTKHRGVSAALLLDIKQLAKIETEREAALRYLYDRLASEPDSPLRGKMSAAAQVAGKIARPAFNRALSPALTRGILKGLAPEKTYGLLRDYFLAFAKELADGELLTRAHFFAAACDCVGAIVDATVKRFGKLRLDHLREVVRPVAQANYAGDLFAGGRSSKRGYALVMEAAMHGPLDPALVGDGADTDADAAPAQEAG